MRKADWLWRISTLLMLMSIAGTQALAVDDYVGFGLMAAGMFVGIIAITEETTPRG